MDMQVFAVTKFGRMEGTVLSIWLFEVKERVLKFTTTNVCYMLKIKYKNWTLE